MRSSDTPAGDGAAARFVSHTVHTADGLELAVDEAGPAAAPALIFVHGIAQSRAAWRPLLRGPLAGRWRLVAYDLRGHGDSSKPTDPALYTEEGRLGADVSAVARGLGLERFALVPWSYGGAVVGDYLRSVGPAQLAGVFAVAASVRLGRAARAYFGPAMMDNVRGLMSADDAVYLAAAQAFIDGCTHTAWPEPTRAALVAAMQQAPVAARRALLTRDEDYVPALSQSQLVVHLLHGEADRVVAPQLSRDVQQALPGAELTLCPEVGHAPFLEAPGAFEAALSAFAAAVF